jgi:phthiocerol/phenolphthiocerol synthesis type-I polyketide synthase D
VLVHCPDWREVIAAKADFDTFAVAALQQILAYSVSSPIYIAGYSFGGFVAFETARRLTKLGYQIAFLGLFDARRWSQFESSLPANSGKKNHLVEKIAEILRKRDLNVNLRRIFRALLELRAFRVLHALAWFCTSVTGQRTRITVRLQLFDAIRSYALRTWLPNSIAAPTYFFRSSEETPHLPDDCGWAALCSPFRIVPVDGNHFTMMNSPHLENLSARLLDAMGAAETCGGVALDLYPRASERRSRELDPVST